MARDIILGAGLAGLSCGICLLDQGREVRLIEAQTALTVKTCGEFLSYESLPLLQTWGITPNFYIERAHFHWAGKSFTFPLPAPCGSMPRLDLENALLRLFLKKGGTVQMGTKADPDSFPGQNVIISSGRGKQTTPKYYGVKNHLLMKPDPDLHMFFTGDSYFGLSPLTEGKAVLSCLSTHPNPQIPIDAPCSFQPWLTTPIASFGLKKLPSRPNTYFLGDAAGTIAPLSGQGMTMAITSGIMAARYIPQDKWQVFQKAWRHRYQRRIHLAKMLNALVFTPSLLPHLFKLLQKHPRLIQKFFTWTRDQ